MFEVAELGHTLDKKEYKKMVPELRTALLNVQEALKGANFPVLILVSGLDGSGKGATVNLLNEWLDPRYLRTFAFGDPSDEERERPAFWRFWRALPGKGRIGLYVGSWYSDPLAKRSAGDITLPELDRQLQQIKAFERELVDDGALIIKVWLHLSKKEQAKRLKTLGSDPKTAWMVTKLDKKHLKKYDHFRSIAEHTLRVTSTGTAPWTIVEASDPYYCGHTVGRHVLEQINNRLQMVNERCEDPDSPRNEPVISNSMSILKSLDLTQKLEKSEYRGKLENLQSKIHYLARKAREKKISSVIVMEGWDAGGKGGLIRRIIPALDARNYQVISIAAPTDEERDHHYLWRFWRHIPRAGQVTIYDRSWYGRVLVERVEGFASHEEWMRAYTEINNFEQQLTSHGTLLLKFWVHIDKEEQLRRFQEREKVSFKKYKITDEDYRNREKWDDYERAVNDMVERTSTEFAPWVMIEGNDKKFARIKAMQHYCKALENALK